MAHVIVNIEVWIKGTIQELVETKTELKWEQILDKCLSG